MTQDFQTQFDIPEQWQFLIPIFIQAVQMDQLMNEAPQVILHNIIQRNNEMKFIYQGGDDRTDAYAYILSQVAKGLIT